MKTRSILLALLVCLFAVSLGFAENPNMGTWKLNEAKSKFAPGMMKNTTVTYTTAGDSVKVATEGTAGDGSPLKTEWTGMFDGKDYPLTGDGAASDIFPWPRVKDDRNLHGPGSIAVPGVVAGMEEAYRRHAKLP